MAVADLIEKKTPTEVNSEREQEKEVTEVSENTTPELENIVQERISPLADDYAIKILSATMNEGKTVRELTRELDIPTATCYRRAEELLEASLLKTIGLTDGDRARIFKSNTSKIEISFKFDDGKLEVLVDSKEDEEENTQEQTKDLNPHQ